MDYVPNWLLGTPDPTDELSELLRNYQDNKEEVKTSIQSFRKTVDALPSMFDSPFDNKQESLKPKDPEVVLIVLHYWRRAVLRGDLSDDDYLLSEELRKRVAFIVHFAFDDEVYDCQQNRTAREMLCSKLEELVLQKT